MRLFSASLPPVPAVVFRQVEGLAHGGGGHILGAGVQVRVDIHGGADVAVAQPLLDQLQIDAVLQQQGDAAVPDIEEADFSQAVLVEDVQLSRCRRKASVPET